MQLLANRRDDVIRRSGLRGHCKGRQRGSGIEHAEERQLGVELFGYLTGDTGRLLCGLRAVGTENDLAEYDSLAPSFTNLRRTSHVLVANRGELRSRYEFHPFGEYAGQVDITAYALVVVNAE